MAFIIGNKEVLSDIDPSVDVSPKSNLDKLQINGVDVLSHSGGIITLKNITFDDASEVSISTDNITEGSTNIFFTDARAVSALSTITAAATTDRALIRTQFAAADSAQTTSINTAWAAADTAQTTSINTAWASGDATTLSSAQSYTDSAVTTGTGSLDTDDIDEGSTNLYYTDARADVRATLRINDSTTDNIDEGSNNLYYTDTRADARAQLKIDALVDSAPGTLNTLNELAAALGDDANYASTTTAAIGANTSGITNLSVATTNAIAALNHDTLSGFVANEHIDWTADQGATNIHINNYTDSGNTTYSDAEIKTKYENNANTNEFSDADHTKLNAIEASADVTDTTNVVAALTAGTNIAIAGNGTISSTDTNTTYTAGNGMTLTGTEFLMSGSYTGSFTATGDVTAYSDERLKRNIETINKPLDIVNALRGVKFEKDGRHSTGVIAQEVEKVLPEVVHTDAEGMKSVAYGNVVGVLIEAIKEQQKQIDWLTAFWQNDAERDSFNKD